MWVKIAVLVLSLLTLGLTIATRLPKRTIRKLTAEFDALKVEFATLEAKAEAVQDNLAAMFSGMLSEISELIEFESNVSFRLTLYIHDARGYFYPCGRYATNPNLISINRPKLPIDEGCIGHAWSTGSCYEGDMTPKLATTTYKVANKAYKEIYKCLRMQSKCYAGKLVRHNGEAIAVLLVEAIPPNSFKKDQVMTVLENRAAYLGRVIAVLKSHLPNPGSANTDRY